MNKTLVLAVAVLTAGGFATVWGDNLTLRIARDTKAVAEKTDLSQMEMPRPSRGWGYFFAAPSGAISGDAAEGWWHLGGGFEKASHSGLGLGAELGYLAPMEDSGEGMGMFSVNGAYHFERGGKTTPFVTFGFSRAFRGGGANFWNIGVGANCWSKRRSALRMELRDHVAIEQFGVHVLGLRLGLSFR